MVDLPHVAIAEEIRSLLPGLRIHGLAFRGARIGIGHRALDVLRTRVSTRLRDRVAAVRDATLLPESEAFAPLLAGLGLDSRQMPPTHAALLRAVARRHPLEVVNDACDVAVLVSLYYLMPVFLVDAAAIAAPLRFLPAPPGLPGPWGDTPAAVPVLADRRGGLCSLVDLRQRAEVTESTRSLLLFLLDPGLGGGLDPRPTARRIANWLGAVAGATLTVSAVSGAAPTSP